MPTVLTSAPYLLPQLDRFLPVFDHYEIDLIVPKVTERLSENAILIHAGMFEGAVCGDDKFTRRVLKACAPRLRVISKWGTGIDSIDRQAATEFGIQVLNTPGAFTVPVSDSVLGYILAFVRQHPWLDRSMKSGGWQKSIGRSLSECTLGIVGVGAIGKAVAQKAAGFEMRILGNDIKEIDPVFCQRHRVEMTSLEDLLTQSDFVSLNCDLNPTSLHLMNRDTIGLMQPSAVLINTARGSIIDESSLIEALKLGAIDGAALDVFEVEPLPKNSPLRSMENVLLAPHNANASPTAWERVHWNTIRNLLIGLGIPIEGLKQFIDILPFGSLKANSHLTK